tara:strand:- start:1331 stop:1894 length:564 start_codon:yes stop_codon:yes gene_type:complete
MAIGLLEFQKKIKAGVRPNQFQVKHNFPAGVGSVEKDDVAIFCKSTSLPATNVGTVELPFRGRVIKVPGDRTYETWTATFYVDDAFKLRGAYEKWIELVNAVDQNTSSVADLGGAYFQDVVIEQLHKFNGGDDLQTIQTYTLASAWPVSVGQISVAYDNNDSFEEFDVEFAYQYHTSDAVSTKSTSK